MCTCNKTCVMYRSYPTCVMYTYSCLSCTGYHICVVYTCMPSNTHAVPSPPTHTCPHSHTHHPSVLASSTDVPVTTLTDTLRLNLAPLTWLKRCIRPLFLNQDTHLLDEEVSST